MITPRPYQTEAREAVFEYWKKGGGNPVVSVATGGGKSFIMADILMSAFEHQSDVRPMIITHVQELILQNYKELIGLWPDAPAGIYSASIGKRQISSQILFAGVASIYTKSYNLQGVDFSIVDEAHLVSPKDKTMYRKLFSDLAKINPYHRVAGVTATEFRAGSGLIYGEKDCLFDDLVFKIDTAALIRLGYLTPLTSRHARTQIDTSKVGTQAGDFIPAQLEGAACDPETIKGIIDEICLNSSGRNGIMVFGSGIKHATLIRDGLREAGITSEIMHGGVTKEDRPRIYDAFRRRGIRALCFYAMGTTGLNFKHVDMIAFARSTKNRGLYEQILGRGTRTTCFVEYDDAEARLAAIAASSKPNCLVLDFGGNIERHGPIDNLKPIKRRGKGGGTAPYKVCPNCGEENHTVARFCFSCNFEFEIAVSTIDTLASTLDIMSDVAARKDLAPEWLDVNKVTYSRHSPRDTNKPNSLKVTYQCGLLWHSEYICLEHTGHAKYKAVSWWKRRAPAGSDVPQTIGEALELVGTLDEPRQIAVRPDGEWISVTGHRNFLRDVAIAA